MFTVIVTAGVLKGVNSSVEHKGLERSQFGLTMSCMPFKSVHNVLTQVLDEVQHLMLKVGMTFGRLISSVLYDARGDVS